MPGELKRGSADDGNPISRADPGEGTPASAGSNSGASSARATTAPIRVLVVEDSASVRAMIVKILESEPAIRVVGTAASGVTALEALQTLRPDVITLDVQMPGMDGIELLKRVRPTHPDLPIIMFSQVTHRGAVTTLEAIFHGATDFVSKPTHAGSAEAAREQVKSQLIPKILAFGGKAAQARSPSSSTRVRPALAAPPAPSPETVVRATPGRGTLATSTPVGVRPSPRVETPAEALPARTQQRTLQRPAIVAIGSSTGGPVALDDIVCALPSDFSVPIVVVQHMPKAFTELLAQRMSTRAKVPVTEATNGEMVTAGKVLLAPGDRHMRLRREGAYIVTEFTNDAPVHGNRPSVDVLFASVARLYGSAALGIVLTGIGKDALAGSRAIVDAGGRVLVQDEASSVVWAMPGQVAKAGLADAVLPIKELAQEIVLCTRRSRGGP